MENFPLNILINIFSYIDNDSKHLINKYFREISMQFNSISLILVPLVHLVQLCSQKTFAKFGFLWNYNIYTKLFELSNTQFLLKKYSWMSYREHGNNMLEDTPIIREEEHEASKILKLQFPDTLVEEKQYNQQL